MKQKIIKDLVTLRDQCDIIDDKSENLQDKLKHCTTANRLLLERVKKLACRVEFRPPVLSEAEECMMREMEGLRDHVKKMLAEMHTVSHKGFHSIVFYKDASPETMGWPLLMLHVML